MLAAQQSSGELCLERIESLRHEINQALSAISSEGVGRLEESLWRQEMLCVGLKHLLPDLRTLQPETLLAGRVREAMKALHALNQTYAEVVKQAQLSNHLLLRLCCNYQLSTGHDVAAGTGTRCSTEA